MTNYVIHGWKADGPVYTRRTYRAGRRNRRNRWIEESVGERRGRNLEQAAYEIIAANDRFETWAFNRGYNYELSVSIDGSEPFAVIVMAEDDYVVHDIPIDVEIIDVFTLDSTGDDAPQAAEREAVAIDEDGVGAGEDRGADS